MGVSIRNPFYSNEGNIIKAINLTKNFDEFLIFIVDYPYRLSLQGFDNLSLNKSETIALKEGIELKKFLINISKNYKNVIVRVWREIEDKDYNIFLKEIRELEKKDEKFSELVKGEFTETVIKKIFDNPNKEELSKEFIMEEIAMFCSLVLKGYKTRISKYERSKSVDYFLKIKNLSINHKKILER